MKMSGERESEQVIFRYHVCVYTYWVFSMSGTVPVYEGLHIHDQIISSSMLHITITHSLHKPEDWGIQGLDNMTRIKQIGCDQSRNLQTNFPDSRDSNHETPLHSLSMRCYGRGRNISLSNNSRERLIFSLLQ